MIHTVCDATNGCIDCHLMVSLCGKILKNYHMSPEKDIIIRFVVFKCEDERFQKTE